ncbi:hypothetical protein N431DRAFT_430676 [Stipitochalara longipes BDJ]|nr:hypothetical protein N431DRAFT_430676 [Stipitochalara longipes BDJ]
MSEYQTTPYGTSYSARDQPNPPYLPPTYPNQYLQGDDGRTGHMGANYDTSVAAYSYNRAIPGFSAAAVASGVPPLPIYQGWNQDSMPLPPYTAPHNPSQYTGYGGTPQVNPQYYQPIGQQTYAPNAAVAKPFEQTDLSEGEFEDVGASINTPPIGYGSNHYHGSDGTGYMDSAQRAVYSRAQDYSPQSAHQANYSYPSTTPSQMRRQQSDSYSPYVSPSGADHDEQSEGAQARNTYAPNQSQDPINGTQQNQYGWAQNGSANRSQQSSYANGYHTSQKPDSSIQAPASSQPALGQLASAANGKSVAEYRKKAEGAILNLLPYDVRYQTYIDEGFKEDIVGALFDDLKMPRTSSKTLNGAQISFNSQPSNDQRNGTVPSSLAAGRNNAPHSASSLPVGTNMQQPKGSSIPQASLSPSINTASSSAPAKSTTMTEKERTLQTKMEALRKSREERAQKAAAKTNPLAASVPASQVEVAKEISEKPNSPPKSPSIPKDQPQTSVAQPTAQQQPPAPPQQQKPPVSIQQQPLMIPGLFLASAAAGPSPPTAPQAALPTPTPSSQRKRPVAADFDDPLPAMNTFKRPFGYSPHNDGRASLVIDLSDDEDEDVAMELDSQADQDSPVQSVRKMSDPRSNNTQNMLPANVPPRKPFTPPNTSATNTPSVSVAKAGLGRPDVLIRKESEIEELKKKIAEAEARKRARQTPSGTRTPRVSELSGSEAKDANLPDGNLGSKVAASIKMQNLIAIADDKATVESQKLADAQAAEIEKAAELKRNEAEQKRLRREKIASDLPLVEAEVLQNQTKLEELRAEMAKIEAAVRKSLEDKQRLAEEMERLGQETEDQLQEQKDKLNSLTQQESRSSNDLSVPAPSPPIEQYRLSSRSKSPTNLPIEAVPHTTAINGESNLLTNTDNDHDRTGDTSSELMQETKNSSIESAPTDQALEAALQEAVRAEADSHSHDSDEMDMEVSYAPNSAQLAPEVPAQPAEEADRSPEYSPELNRTVPEVTDRESDGYEPPDATAPTEALESPPFSPAPPESVHHEVADESMQDVNSPQPLSEDGQIASDDARPLVNGTPQVVLEDVSKEDPNKIHLFTPYESPLKQFRAYRFHPEFKQDIAGGLRSMTYSHKIDPNAEFCRYELAGGICNDTTCDLQHFRDIKLPDDAVLTALGSPDEFTGEQREKFCEGLRQVLMDLRVRKIRDFDIIASEIVAHRSKFLGDTSKVLALEGTTI